MPFQLDTPDVNGLPCYNGRPRVQRVSCLSGRPPRAGGAERVRRVEGVVGVRISAGFIALSLVGVLPASQAQGVVDRIQGFYEQTTGVTGQFHQRVELAIGHVEEAWGAFSLKRPGMMRWEYEGPEQRLLVTDASTLWAYTPADRQVSAVVMREGQRTTVTVQPSEAEVRARAGHGQVDLVGGGHIADLQVAGGVEGVRLRVDPAFVREGQGRDVATNAPNLGKA